MMYKTRMKVSKFFSFFSIVTATFALVIFMMQLPDIISSIAGRTFAGLWFVATIAVMWTHSLHILQERRYRRLSRLLGTSEQLKYLQRANDRNCGLKKHTKNAYFSRSSI